MRGTVRAVGIAATFCSAAVFLGSGSGAVAQGGCANADSGPAAGTATLAEAVACLIAEERSLAGVSPVVIHGSLMRSAQAHAADMVARRYLASRSPEGADPAARAAAANYTSDAEDITVGEAFTFGEGPAATPRAALAAWKADPDFRAVVLDPDARHLGVGVVAGAPFPVDSAAATYVADVGSQLRPDLGRTAVAGATAGVVYVRQPGSSRFVRLTGRRGIRMGSIIDARRGRVRLTTARNSQGRPQTAEFFNGTFRVTQRRITGATTVIELTELLGCPRAGRASAAASRKKRRLVWGNGKGKFRTRGRYATATVVGTRWKTEDTCAGTRITVTRGVVVVRDLSTGRTRRVRAGGSVFVRAR